MGLAASIDTKTADFQSKRDGEKRLRDGMGMSIEAKKKRYSPYLRGISCRILAARACACPAEGSVVMKAGNLGDGKTDSHCRIGNVDAGQAFSTTDMLRLSSLPSDFVVNIFCYCCFEELNRSNPSMTA